MKKINLGVVFGGMSTENEVSIVSGTSVVRNLNKEKYNIYPIYISKSGEWFSVENFLVNSEIGNVLKDKSKINNIYNYLCGLDVVFPVLHGLYGEDGTIQGLFELLKIPYVGCNVLASSIGMDKVYAKIIFKNAGLNQTQSIYIQKREKEFYYYSDSFDDEKMDIDEIVIKAVGKLKFPMFVKPSNSGSSVGVTKAHNEKELKEAIKVASRFDNKILIEQGIEGREVECGVLGNGDVVSSCIGEIKSADEFYTYDAKYNNRESKTIIPADLPDDIANEIKRCAIKAFKAINGCGLARVDFFVENKTNKVYVNEINTMPGFTNISMYPKLFEKSGIIYPELLDKLIVLALQ